jgi:hypothetical protein
MEKLSADERSAAVKKDLASLEDELLKLAKSQASSTAAGAARQKALAQKLDVWSARCSAV